MKCGECMWHHDLSGQTGHEGMKNCLMLPDPARTVVFSLNTAECNCPELSKALPVTPDQTAVSNISALSAAQTKLTMSDDEIIFITHMVSLVNRGYTTGFTKLQLKCIVDIHEQHLGSLAAAP